MSERRSDNYDAELAWLTSPTVAGALGLSVCPAERIAELEANEADRLGVHDYNEFLGAVQGRLIGRCLNPPKWPRTVPGLSGLESALDSCTDWCAVLLTKLAAETEARNALEGDLSGANTRLAYFCEMCARYEQAGRELPEEPEWVVRGRMYQTPDWMSMLKYIDALRDSLVAVKVENNDLTVAYKMMQGCAEKAEAALATARAENHRYHTEAQDHISAASQENEILTKQLATAREEETKLLADIERLVNEAYARDAALAAARAQEREILQQIRDLCSHLVITNLEQGKAKDHIFDLIDRDLKGEPNAAVVCQQRHMTPPYTAGELLEVANNTFIPSDFKKRESMMAMIREFERNDEPINAARPTIVCLCGSGRFRKAFEEAEYRETLAGKIVLTIGCNTHDIARTDELRHYKPMLDELHKRKIDICDEVLVLNVGNYIGNSTRSEIDYALAHHKPVRYLELGVNTPNAAGQINLANPENGLGPVPAAPAHPQTDHCGFDRNASHSAGHYVCNCGWKAGGDAAPPINEAAARRERSEGQPDRWKVFCALCKKTWDVPYYHAGRGICDSCYISLDVKDRGVT